MNSFTIIFFVLQAVLIQNAYSHVIRDGCCGICTPIIATPSVANTLADTLSLLTVSSLLAETLPFNPDIIATVPVPVPYVGCGCGCGCGYDLYDRCGCDVCDRCYYGYDVVDRIGYGFDRFDKCGCGCDKFGYKIIY